MCLSQPVSYECSVDTTDGADTLRWEIFDATNSQVGVVSFNQGQTLPAMSSISTDFTATLTDSSGPILSDVTFTPSVSISNYTIECEARGTDSFTPVTCPILIAGRIFYLISGSNSLSSSLFKVFQLLLFLMILTSLLTGSPSPGPH